MSSNENLLLETTANVNLSTNNPSISIPSSDFDIRYNLQPEPTNSDFIIILYEQRENETYQNIFLNKTSHILETNNFAIYNIQIQSKLFDLIDFIVMKADNGTLIRLYDSSK